MGLLIEASRAKKTGAGIKSTEERDSIKTKIFGLFITMAVFLLIAASVNAQAGACSESNCVYLPFIQANPPPTATPTVASTDTPTSSSTPTITPAATLPVQLCSPNAQEQDIANRMKSDPDQQRPALNCDPILAQVARARAMDMGVRAYFNHVNPDGFGANYLVQQAGYLLPSWYGQDKSDNNIESIAAGYSTAAAVWNGWMSSSGHRTHILGLDPFWAEQTDYGIGYAFVPGSPYGSYWVVITARRGP